jgi:hypothetical protein
MIDDDDGTEIRGKACENGWCVCDIKRKVPTVGYLGEEVTLDPERLGSRPRRSSKNLNDSGLVRANLKVDERSS